MSAKDLNEMDGWGEAPEPPPEAAPGPPPEPKEVEPAPEPKEPKKRSRRSLKQAERIVRTSVIRSIRAGLYDGLTNEELQSIIEGLDFLGYLPEEFVREALGDE